MDRLLLPGIVSFAVGIGAGTIAPLPWQLAAVVAVSGCVVILFAREAWLLVGGVVLLCGALGVVRVAVVPQAPPTPFLPLFDTKLELIGRVAGDPDVRETTQRVPVEIREEGQSMRVIAVAGRYPQYSYGEAVRVTGKLERPTPFDTDGGRIFRYDQYLAKDGVFGIIHFAQVEAVAEPDLGARLHGLLYTGKRVFMDGLGAALSEPAAGLAGGLIAGGKQGLGKELLEAFTVVGLVHIVVLSGYNVMIVAEAVLRSLWFLGTRRAAVTAGMVIALFVLAAGAGTASVRAGIMAGLGLFARATNRTYDALRALLFVFLLMLLMNPLLLVYDPGFQFSFAATLGLILGAPIIEMYLHWLRPVFLRGIIATTIAAQLFVLPLLLYHTGNLSPLALPANLLALPAVPLAMLFSGIAGVVGMVAPEAAPLAGFPAYILLTYLIQIAERGAMLPGAEVIIPAFSFWFVPLLYALLAVVLIALIRRVR